MTNVLSSYAHSAQQTKARVNAQFIWTVSRKHINISTRHIAIKSFMGAREQVAEREALCNSVGSERRSMPPVARKQEGSGQLPLYLDKRTRIVN